MSSIDSALSLLRGAILNSRIYPAGSQIIQMPATAAFKALSVCLQESPKFTICDQQNKLMLNEDTEIHMTGFLQELKQHDVQILTFTQGLTNSEVMLLAQGFAKKKNDPDMADGLPHWLSKQGVKHVEISRAQFVAVPEGDQIGQQMKTLFGKGNFEMTAAVIARLEQALRDLDGLPPEAIQKRKAEIVTDLTRRSVDELQALVESDLPEDFFKSGLSQSMVQSLDLEKSEQFFNEIITWAGGLTRPEQASALTKTKMQRLRRFLKALTDTPGTRLISTAILEKLAKLQLVESVPSGFLAGTESFSVVAYVEHLLSLPARSVLKDYVVARLAPVIQSLCAIEADDALRRLLERVLVNLSDEDPNIRATAVKTLHIVQSRIQSVRRTFYLTFIRQALVALAEVEGSSLVYQEITQLLAASAMVALSENRSNEAFTILQFLARHRIEGHPQFEARKPIASKALVYFANEAMGILSSYMHSSQSEQEIAFRIFHLLGEDAIPLYIELAKYSADPLQRQLAVALLRQWANSARSQILEHFQVGVSANDLLRLFPVFENLSDPNLSQKAMDLLSHPVGTIRAQALKWVVAVPGHQADEALSRMLEDPDTSVALEAVRHIRQQDNRKLCAALLGKLSDSPPEVQEQILLTFGQWKPWGVIPVLNLLLQGQKRLFSRKPSGAPSGVRVRAAWVLGQLLPDSTARSLLTKLLQDNDPLVRRTAQDALHPAKRSESTARNAA